MVPENKKATSVFPFHGNLPSWLYSASDVNVESDPALSSAFNLLSPVVHWPELPAPF